MDKFTKLEEAIIITTTYVHVHISEKQMYRSVTNVLIFYTVLGQSADGAIGRINDFRTAESDLKWSL